MQSEVIRLIWHDCEGVLLVLFLCVFVRLCVCVCSWLMSLTVWLIISLLQVSGRADRKFMCVCVCVHITCKNDGVRLNACTPSCPQTPHHTQAHVLLVESSQKRSCNSFMPNINNLLLRLPWPLQFIRAALASLPLSSSLICQCECFSPYLQLFLTSHSPPFKMWRRGWMTRRDV